MHYWSGIDRTTSTMINVSVWKSLSNAKQMETLPSMLALASEFVKLGVVFERPVANYERFGRFRRGALVLMMIHM